MKYLLSKDIQTRQFFYPLHMQPCYQDSDQVIKKSCPNSKLSYDMGISLPSSYNLAISDQMKVIEEIKNFFFLKIGINLLSIDPNYSGGVTSFTFGILNGLIINEEIEIQLYVHKGNKDLFKDFINHKNVNLIELDYGRFRNFFF